MSTDTNIVLLGKRVELGASFAFGREMPNVAFVHSYLTMV